tara:strand:+ start:459 stop:1052 length:594 start_codon:yes stop_codon:yes gene_type:complete
MPIIKDKYGAKGSQDRSKYVNRVDIKPTNTVQENLNTEQIQAAQAIKIRELESPSIISKIQNIPEYDTGKEMIGLRLTTINTLQEIVVVSKGEYLSNILVGGIMSSNAELPTTVISLYWSYYSLESIYVSISDGIINGSAGSPITRIFSYDLKSNATISLSGDNELKDFGNFNKDVYIYALTNTIGQDFTIIKKSVG